MVECCWTAASSSLSKMVHSPMVMERWQGCQKKQDLGSRPLFLQRTPFSSISSQDRPVLLWTCRPAGVHPTPVLHQLPFDLYTLTWLLVSASLTVCGRVSVFSWACPAVLLFLVEERCCADCLPLLSPSVSSLLPLPCAVMLVLPLPHHSVLHYSICYSSLYDSHDHPLFSTCLSPSPCSFLLCLFLLCARLRPPPYPQGTPCTLPALPAISAILRSSLHCVGSLPLLHPCYSNLNTHTHTHTLHI